MSHSHSGDQHASPALLDPGELRRHRKAFRILIVTLIPLAIWTAFGLFVLWPGDISAHVRKDVAGFTVPGVTYPTAQITAVEEVSCEGLVGSTPGVSDTHCANITADITQGDGAGSSVTVPLTNALYASGAKVGQEIKLIRVPPSAGQPAQYQFSDFQRSTPLWAIAILFAIAVIAVARWRGLASLLGLVFAGFILVKFMFPALVAGSNPILVGLIGSSAIMFVVLYAAHGISARTTTALVGTLFGLCLSAGLGYVATRWAHLTGVAAEDDYVLAAAAPNLSLTSVVLCGIIIAGLGVLNDVTITQASAVWELADADNSSTHLFSRAMRIGRDHIASTVYTIVFATAGASLPVLLLIAIYDRPLLQVLQTEQFAGELVRILVGSIGLVLAVPLTTAIGVAVVRVSGVRREAHQPAAAEGTLPAGTEGLDQGSPPEVPAVAEAPRRPDPSTSRHVADPEPEPEPEPVPERRAPSRRVGSDQPDTDATTLMPALRRRRPPSGDDDATTVIPAVRRRRRSDDDESFGFSDLRDPDAPTKAVQPPRGKGPGRRAL